MGTFYDMEPFYTWWVPGLGWIELGSEGFALLAGACLVPIDERSEGR